VTQPLVALIVDKRPDLAQELVKSLNQAFSFAESDFTNSVHRAVQSHLDGEYSICFISDEFPSEELSSFFSDMLKMERANKCVFLQVSEKEPTEELSKLAIEIGFHGFISRRGTSQDKETISQALKNTNHHQEVKKRTLDVRGAISLILRELDRVARERKRGIDRHMAAIPMSLVEIHSEFDPILIKRYFDELDRQASLYKPFKTHKVDIPDRILKKQLPGLAKDKYSGASHRVWEMLLDKHGVGAGLSPKPDSSKIIEEPQTESTEEETESPSESAPTE